MPYNVRPSIEAIPRKSKGKHDTRHDSHGPEHKKEFKNLVERIARHHVVQEQNTAQKQSGGADRPRWLLRNGKEQKRDYRKSRHQLHVHAQAANRLVPLDGKDHAGRTNQ